MQSNKLKVLSIGTDRNLFTEGSEVSERIKEHGKRVEELHIIVFALKSLGLKERQLAPNVWVYPTNSISRWLYIGDGTRIGKKLVKDRKFVRGQSLITAQDPFECGLVGFKIKKKWRLPLEIQMHIDPLFSEGFDGPLDRIRVRMVNKIVKSADSIRVVSDFIKDRLEGKFSLDRKHVYTLPVYIDKEKVQNAQISFDLHARFGWHFVILTVARLTAQKNLGFALEILQGVHARFPDTGLVIVGTGKDEKKLKSLTAKLGLENNVAFEGWQENLASYYKTANMFLQTSHFEGYGMALVEAGLSGLPIVTTPVGLAAELDNNKDAYVCPPGNLQYFTDAIVDLIEHNQARENLRVNMKRTLEQKLLSKEDYLNKLIQNWEITSAKVK